MASILDDMTAEWLKATYLAGIDLTLDDGTPFDERIYTDSLKGAFNFVRNELSVQLEAIRIHNERHDASGKQRDTWWFTSLDHRPVQKVTGVRMQYGQTPAADLPVDWINVMSQTHGQIQIVPTTTAVGSFEFIGGVPNGLSNMVGGYLPGYLVFDYIAGFEFRKGTVVIPKGDTSAVVTFGGEPFNVANYALEFALVNPAVGDTGIQVSTDYRDAADFGIDLSAAVAGNDGLTVAWTLSTLPADLRQIVGMVAATLAQLVAGDLIGGAGIASSSLSMDGLSQSINTTSSPENTGYSARVKDLERQIKVLLPALRGKYRMPNLFAS